MKNISRTLFSRAVFKKKRAFTLFVKDGFYKGVTSYFLSLKIPKLLSCRRVVTWSSMSSVPWQLEEVSGGGRKVIQEVPTPLPPPQGRAAAQRQKGWSAE